jgi:hypothetical protein
MLAFLASHPLLEGIDIIPFSSLTGEGKDAVTRRILLSLE